MTWRAPALLWLLALVPFALAVLVMRERHRTAVARRFMSERLRGVASPVRALRPYALALALALAIVAAAGPRFGFTTMPVATTQTNRVIVLDVSNSMAAEDVGTSRLAAAKAIAKRIVAAEPGRVALVLFEADAQVASPLTTDDDAVAALIDSLAPGDLTEPGSDLGNALTLAARLIESDPGQKADVVVISDGEDQGPHFEDTLRMLKTRGIPVTAIAVGTRGGATMPMENGWPLRDATGDPIVTYAHPEVLEKVAAATGGRFFENPFAERSLDALLDAERRGARRQRDVRVPVERFQWPLALAFVAMLCGSFANRGAE